jgi:stage V sporulation protein R
MFHDIKRICENPTEEDRVWFPHMAGEDWLETMKHARDYFKDESFIQQYMSPKIMRDFKFFAMENDEKNEFYEILAIHDKDGFHGVRENLSAQYRLDELMPVLGVAEYYDKTDRRLVIQHQQHNEKPLEKKNITEVTKHIYRLWEHPVVVQSIDADGDVSDEIQCPPKPKNESVRRKNERNLYPH